MKNKLLLICILLLVGLIVITIICMFVRNYKPQGIKTQEFNTADYNKQISAFSVKDDYVVHKINDTTDVIKVAQIVFKEEFGYNEEYKPYAVFYDKSNRNWMVKGTLSSKARGGVPILLIKGDGSILAIWHTK